MTQRQVFISYAWGGESEKVANEIEAKLNSEGILLIRDKTDLGFKGLIQEFMQKIGQGDFVVLIISDKYLKSKNCMFELLEVAKNGAFHSRVFPVVLPDANIYDSLTLIDYYHYWQQKIVALNTKIKTLNDLSDTRRVVEELDLYTDIRGAIDDLAGKLSNMNTLTVEIMRASNYGPLVNALRSAGERSKEQGSKPTLPKRKEGKILYHIPNMMQVDKWTRCTVRLAWEEILLLEGLKIPEDQQVIESIRLGNVMQVSLNEGQEGGNFEFKVLTNEEQVIFEDDFTEWLFDVKARTVGNFTLILRVTIIQIIEGKERKKDIVMERDVMTESIVPRALAKFETATAGLSRSIPSEKEAQSISIESQPNSINTSNGRNDRSQMAPERTDAESSQDRSISSPLPTPVDPTKTATSTIPKSLFKRVLPYAASLMILIVAGFLGFDWINVTDMMSSTSESALENQTIENGISPDQNMLIALSMESSTISGEAINETMLFVVSGTSVDSLLQIDPGMYSISVYPASDTIHQHLGAIQESSILEIQDSVKKKLLSTPNLGDNLIQSQDLQTSPVFHKVKINPQHLDSATSSKLRLSVQKAIKD